MYLRLIDGCICDVDYGTAPSGGNDEQGEWSAFVSGEWWLCYVSFVVFSMFCWKKVV